MSNPMVVTVDPYKVTRKIKNFHENKADEFLDLVKRAYKKNPNQKDLSELRKWLANYPELWQGVFDLSEIVRQNFIKRITSEDAAQIALEKNISVMREEFGYSSASIMERILIENIIISWLQNEWLEYQLVTFMGNGEIRMSVVEFWERRLSISQRRYLLACETLAKIRRLSVRNPALQVNIATQNGQQVNVAGDLVKKE